MNQIVKLKLKNVHQNEMDNKFKEDPSNDDAAYYGTTFQSEFSYEYHFFVQHLGYKPLDQVGYYVLARPNSDSTIYTRY